METSCLDVCDVSENHSLQVKIRSGASIVKIRPLFTSDSKHLIVASGINVKIFNISSAECIQTLRKHKEEIVSLQENKKNHLQIYSCDVSGIVIRWDYLEGQVLEIYDLEVYPVAAFYAPSPNETVYLVVKLPTEDANGLFKLSMKFEKKKNPSKMPCTLKNVLPQENTIAFGAECSFVASVMDSMIQLRNLTNGKYKRHFYGDRTLLCVACHPTDNILATGDNHGRVIIWADAMNSNHPTKSLYHWHSLPLADLSFSSEGTYLYSGGGEHALVKWHLGSEVRHILPRIGLPIYRMAASPDNFYIVTAHEDNALQIINSLTSVVQIIQGLTQGHRHGNGNIFSTGMLYDSRSEALVMNGKPGHLQFYNIQEDKQLFNLDIVGRNVISQERNMVIVNTDVQKAALDSKGQWLATVEYWNDGEMNPEIRLKFWEFDASKQTFVLNTYVFLPHNKEVNCVGFRPSYEDSDNLPLAVTSSSDGKFKTWVLNYDDNPDKKESWSCESMGYYRDLPAGDACFSQDGSLLGVAFGHVATLWEPNSMVLKARFFQPNNKNIRQIMFGNGSCCHLLVCSSDSMITVWNVLTLSVQLTINCRVQFLAPDRKSDVIAAFCKNNDLIIFKPSNPTPICYKKSISKTPVIAAIFVPKPKLPGKKQLNENCWHKNSQLFFLNKDQNLLTIDDESDEEEDGDNHKVKIEQNIPVTPFGMLQAQQKITDVKTDFSKLHISAPEVDAKIFDVSCPTNQNPIALCSLILPSLLIKLDKKDTDVSITSLNFEENRTKLYSTAPEAMDVDKVIPAKESMHMTDFVGITDFSFLRKSVRFSMTM